MLQIGDGLVIRPGSAIPPSLLLINVFGARHAASTIGVGNYDAGVHGRALSPTWLRLCSLEPDQQTSLSQRARDLLSEADSDRSDHVRG